MMAKEGDRSEESGASVAWRMRRTVLVGVLLGILMIGGTLAYLFQILKPMNNGFSFLTKTIDVEIDENEYDWEAKQVELRNVNTADAVPGVVRVMVVPVLKTGGAAGDPGLAGSFAPLTAPVGDTMTLGDFVFTFKSNWADDWFFKDGFFYYRRVLQPGESTTRLLERVSLADPALSERYIGMRIEVEVMADIIQAADGAPTDAWGVYVQGIVVSPDPI